MRRRRAVVSVHWRELSGTRRQCEVGRPQLVAVLVLHVIRRRDGELARANGLESCASSVSPRAVDHAKFLALGDTKDLRVASLHLDREERSDFQVVDRWRVRLARDVMRQK